MNITEKKWDFFIAHAGVDTPIAEELYDLLAGSAKVFLDSRLLELGDNRDVTLATAQRQARITIVTVSQNTDAAYYQRVEVAQAINMSRDLTNDHRVIPLYVDEASTKGLSAQYGLNLKHGLFLSGAVTLETAAFRLLSTVKRLQYQTVLFDSREGAAGFFKGYANSFWTGKGKERSSAIGEGKLILEPGGILAITRTSTEGRFEVQLCENESSGPSNIWKVFPSREQFLADRRLWIHCEARSDGAKHGLRFVLKNQATDSWLANEKRIVDSKDWTQLDVYFQVDPKLDFWFRIDAEEVSNVPSELRLRNIVLRERGPDT